MSQCFQMAVFWNFNVHLGFRAFTANRRNLWTNFNAVGMNVKKDAVKLTVSREWDFYNSTKDEFRKRRRNSQRIVPLVPTFRKTVKITHVHFWGPPSILASHTARKSFPEHTNQTNQNWFPCHQFQHKYHSLCGHFPCHKQKSIYLISLLYFYTGNGHARTLVTFVTFPGFTVSALTMLTRVYIWNWIGNWGYFFVAVQKKIEFSINKSVLVSREVF